ncbi:MAG: DUF4190 domain-containing protein [Aquihabitans sp.]
MAARCVNGHDTPRGRECMYCGAPLEVAPPVTPPPMAYAAPPPGSGAAWPPQPSAPPELSALAVVSLVLGLVCGIGSIPAIVIGGIALHRIRRRNQSGRGLAIAGIVLGIIPLVASLVAAIVIFTSNGIVEKDGGTGGGRGTSGCEAEYRTLRTATEAYYAMNTRYPQSLDDLYGTFLKEESRGKLRFRMVPPGGAAAPTFESHPGACPGVGD